MSVETFLGNEIIEIYKQIQSKYPNGVEYISTKQLNEDGKVRYAISFFPIIKEEVEDTSLIFAENTAKDETKDFLESLKELEEKLKELEDSAKETDKFNFYEYCKEQEELDNDDFIKEMEEFNNSFQDDEITEEQKAPKDELTQENNEIFCIDKIRKELIKKGIDENWLENIIDDLLKNNIKEDKNLILNYILDEIESTFIFENNINQKPRILMMVGPTGIGKTTSVAKIALKFAFDIEKDNVAFINLDQSRVAASEQLKSYASLLGVNYADINEESEFTEQLEEFDDKKLIFVDTGGISPFDIKRLIDTVSFISEASEHDISIALVLSATLKKEDMESIYENFSFLSPSYLILTKFDETASITGLANFLITCDIPMYYFSVGQDIHKDLIPANSEYLRDRLMKEWQSIDCGSLI